MNTLTAIKEHLFFVAASYFRFFANFSLRRWHPKIIAITGSVGKTTMLRLIEYELGDQAHYSHNANSIFGVAFDLVGTKGVKKHKLRWVYLFFAVPIRSIFYKHTEPYYVVEIDGGRPHGAESIAKWLRPDISLWVSLGRSHAAFYDEVVAKGQFESIDKAIAHEFAMLPQYTKQTVYIDGDVPLMVKACQKVKKHHNISAKIVKCYKENLKKYQISPDHTDFTLKGNGKYLQTVFHFYDPMPKDIAIQLVMLQNLCSELEIPLKTDFKGLQLPPGRNSYLKGRNKLQLIDSTYNAHLISVEAILRMVSEMKSKEKWFVLGDMGEQGSIESEEHTKLASIIKQYHPSQVVLVGPLTGKYTVPALKKAKIPVFHADERPEALDFIEKNTKGGETIVFKASNSQGLGWVVENLLDNPNDAARLPYRRFADPKRIDL